MAKKVNEQNVGFQFPLGQRNLLILGIGVLLLFVGFYVMGLADHPDDFNTITLAPIILFIAFVIVIPFGIMYRVGEAKEKKDPYER